MPKEVTAPSVLQGHAREVWKSAFLGAFNGTCKEKEEDERESCSAAIAWSAVKSGYKKNEKTGEWIEKAEAGEGDTRGDGMDQYPSPISSAESVAPIPAGLPEEARNIFDMAYQDALRVACAQASEPRKCAVQEAWGKVYEEYYKTDNNQWVKRTMIEKLIYKHYGPGPHASGSSQDVHGKGGGGGAKPSGGSKPRKGAAGKPRKPQSQYPGARNLNKKKRKQWIDYYANTNTLRDLKSYESGAYEDWMSVPEEYGRDKALAQAEWEFWRDAVNYTEETLGTDEWREQQKQVKKSVIIEKHYGPGSHPGSGTPQSVHGGGGLRAGVSGESGRTLKPMHKYTSESRQPGELGMDSIDPQGKYYRITNDAFSREFYSNDIGKVFSERPMYAPSVELTGEQVLAEWEADFDPYSENIWENPANLSSLKTLQSELGEEAGLTSWVKIYGTDTASYMTDTRTVDRMLELLKGQYDNADRANNKNQRNAIKRLMGIFMDRKRELTNKSVAMTAEAFQARRFFDREKRKKLAESGKALPWGGFPIENCEDVKNAVRAIGRAKDRSRTIAHIKKHASSLGCSHLIPKKWRSGSEAKEKSVAAREDSKFYESEETLVNRARIAGIDDRVLLKRRAARAKAHSEDIALLEAGYADHPARRPENIASEVWRSMEPHLKTVGAIVWRRHIERKYEEAVEDALLKGWKGEKNPSRPDEWIFKSWVDTPDGWQLVRTILVRKSDSDEWYMKEISRGASRSLAIRVAPHEARR
jgi:cation transport regulator ChaB